MVAFAAPAESGRAERRMISALVNMRLAASTGPGVLWTVAATFRSTRGIR